MKRYLLLLCLLTSCGHPRLCRDYVQGHEYIVVHDRAGIVHSESCTNTSHIVKPIGAPIQLVPVTDLIK